MRSSKTNLNRWGWMMFTLSGVFFLVSAARAGDWVSGAGSVVWLVGVAFFLLE